MSREGPVADPCLILCGIAIVDKPICDIGCKQEQLTWQIQQRVCSEDRTQGRKNFKAESTVSTMHPFCALERLLLLSNTVNKAIVSLEPGVHLYSRLQHSKLKTKKCRCLYKSISGHQQIELHWLGADSSSPHPAQLLATLNGISGFLPGCPPSCFAVTAVHRKA